VRQNASRTCTWRWITTLAILPVINKRRLCRAPRIEETAQQLVDLLGCKPEEIPADQRPRRASACGELLEAGGGEWCQATGLGVHVGRSGTRALPSSKAWIDQIVRCRRAYTCACREGRLRAAQRLRFVSTGKEYEGARVSARLRLGRIAGEELGRPARWANVFRGAGAKNVADTSGFGDTITGARQSQPSKPLRGVTVGRAKPMVFSGI
jgi:translation elongation factor EF-4